MSEERSTGWVQSFISRAPASGKPAPSKPPPPHPDNVVQMPRPSLDDRTRRLRSLDQQLMDIAIEMDRLGMQFNAIREDLMRERALFLDELKVENVKAAFTHEPPEVELLGPGS